MSLGRSIRLFLVDGTPNGLLTAEILNWSGHVLTGPRSKLAELVKRPECSRPGVYFLVGQDPQGTDQLRVYVGESDDVAGRLKQHNASDDKNFFERVCLVTSNDSYLTKSHIKVLESQLIGIAKQTGRCVLANSKEPVYQLLPEADLAYMAAFLEQIRIVLPVLGYDFLREITKPSQLSLPHKPIASTISQSPVFTLTNSARSISARAQEIDGEFFVLKDSAASVQWTSTAHSYQTLFTRLVNEEAIALESGGLLRVFVDDYAFKSPSAAAAVVLGRNANGRKEWVIENTKQSYGAWQDQQLNIATPEPEAI
jgi:hypothetical protein